MTGTERDLEKPFERLLEVQLARELTQSAPELEIRNTARGGLTGGRWTKPDIVVASVDRYLSLAVPLLSLYGFELKTQAGFELSSIYQAAAQTRFLHFAWRVDRGDFRRAQEELKERGVAFHFEDWPDPRKVDMT